MAHLGDFRLNNSEFWMKNEARGLFGNNIFGDAHGREKLHAALMLKYFYWQINTDLIKNMISAVSCTSLFYVSISGICLSVGCCML